MNSYHRPGFATDSGYDERQILGILRNEAFALRGETPPLLPRLSPAPVSRRGSTGASAYVLERVSRAEGPWQCIAADLEDSVVADVAAYEGGRDPAPVVLFIDKTAPAETLLFYRINAVNATGETVSSNVVEFMRHWVRRHLFVLHVTLAQADGTVSID